MTEVVDIVHLEDDDVKAAEVAALLRDNDFTFKHYAALNPFLRAVTEGGGIQARVGFVLDGIVPRFTDSRWPEVVIADAANTLYWEEVPSHERKVLFTSTPNEPSILAAVSKVQGGIDVIGKDNPQALVAKLLEFRTEVDGH